MLFSMDRCVMVWIRLRTALELSKVLACGFEAVSTSSVTVSLLGGVVSPSTFR
jgi:hypothetical protein